jgi:hypothetical protein
MKRFDSRILIGGGLVLLGALMFAERLGIFRGAIEIFWGIAFILGASYFLYRFARNTVADWWAVIPGLALAGLAAESLLPRLLGGSGGFFFLGSLGLAFFVVYLAHRQRWWAIIPGGVLASLAAIALLEETLGISDAGGLLFVGLGATFILLALATSMRWAYIPGITLLAFGAILGLTATSGMEYLWPAVLVACGLLLIWRFSRSR